MFGLGGPELMIIMAIAFLIFGGKKLPELGAGLGEGINAFKKGLRNIEAPSPEHDEAPQYTKDTQHKNLP